MADEQDETNGVEKVVGKAREALGWATADRREEAKGKLQQLDAEQPDDAADGDPEAALDEAELHVRDDHGDLAPEAQPEDHEPADPPEPG